MPSIPLFINFIFAYFTSAAVRSGQKKEGTSELAPFKKRTWLERTFA